METGAKLKKEELSGGLVVGNFLSIRTVIQIFFAVITLVTPLILMYTKLQVVEARLQIILEHTEKAEARLIEIEKGQRKESEDWNIVRERIRFLEQKILSLETTLNLHSKGGSGK